MRCDQSSELVLGLEAQVLVSLPKEADHRGDKKPAHRPRRRGVQRHLEALAELLAVAARVDQLVRPRQNCGGGGSSVRGPGSAVLVDNQRRCHSIRRHASLLGAAGMRMLWRWHENAEPTGARAELVDGGHLRGGCVEGHDGRRAGGQRHPAEADELTRGEGGWRGGGALRAVVPGERGGLGFLEEEDDLVAADGAGVLDSDGGLHRGVLRARPQHRGGQGRLRYLEGGVALLQASRGSALQLCRTIARSIRRGAGSNAPGQNRTAKAPCSGP